MIETPYVLLVLSACALIIVLALVAFVFALYLQVKTLSQVPTLLFQSKQTQMALGIVSERERAEEEPAQPSVTEEVPRYDDSDFMRGIQAQRAARQEPADVLYPEDVDKGIAPEEFAPGSAGFYTREA